MWAALLLLHSPLLLPAGASPSSSPPSAYLDWSVSGGRSSQPTCVDIPLNMSLCHGIGYTKMRLPNLLEHDTMAEVSQQARSWVPLLNVRCHLDTQLFLCSLFSPVCLDRPIYPCRSLCQAVQTGCEMRMQAYGFPWPDMLRCDRFPLDNDMCIRPQATAEPATNGSCLTCNQVETYENILDNFCRADFAVRTRIRRGRKKQLLGRKAKIFKHPFQKKEEVKVLRRPIFTLDPDDSCCESKAIRGPFLVMGHNHSGLLVPSFLMPWAKNSKAFKKAVRMFKRINCTDPNMVSQSVIPSGFPKNDNGRRRRGQRQKKRKNAKRNEKTV